MLLPLLFLLTLLFPAATSSTAAKAPPLKPKLQTYYAPPPFNPSSTISHLVTYMNNAVPGHVNPVNSLYYPNVIPKLNNPSLVKYTYSDVLSHSLQTLPSKCEVTDPNFSTLLSQYIIFITSLSTTSLNTTSASLLLTHCGPRTPFYKMYGYENSVILPVHFSRDGRWLSLQRDVVSYMLLEKQNEESLKAAATQSVTNLKNPAHLRKLTFLNNTFSDSTNPYLASYLDPPFSTDVDSLPERIYSNTEKVQITQLITYGGKYQTHSRKWASGGKTWSEPIWKVDGGKVEYYDTGCGGEEINNCINGGFGWIKGNWGKGGRDVGRGLEMFKIACDNGKACGKWCFWNYVTGQDPTTYTAFCENLIAKHESRYQTTDSDDLGCGFTKSGVEYSVETRKQLNLKEPGQCDDHLLLYYGLKNLKADVQKSNRFIMEAAEIGNEHAMYLSAMIAIGYKGKGSHNVNWSLKNDYALNALRVAAGFGHAPSVYGLGRLEKNEEDRICAFREVLKRDLVVRELKFRAEGGCEGSLRILADAKVEWGMEKSDEFAHLVESSELGNWKSRLKLGDAFFYNETQPWYTRYLPSNTRSKQIAVQHYRLAASGSGNSAKANWYLGWCYEWGVGVEQDYPMAKRYYDRAKEDAENGVIGGVSVTFLRVHEKVEGVVNRVRRQIWNLMKFCGVEVREEKVAEKKKNPKEVEKEVEEVRDRKLESKEQEEWRKKGAIFSKGRKKEPQNKNKRGGKSKKKRSTHTTQSYLSVALYHMNPFNDLTIVFICILALLANLLKMYREHQVRVNIEARRLWEERFARVDSED
ncbi:hypothetical protein TrLO_g7050 [Triparma laevis f. longispina]|uniref:Uncharacterized protein n=1 Tax=Triparma laevis f. longispina TaxID=1714387 RepID=A0A9W7L013_9STRA|nr:hypothetical protein TrLO_g7050 [Triparma laevis f. longispina]